ncbi:MAG: hypothetical protein Q9220_005312 [cf. Caloplaca sp. 1 TL-2023]
MGRHLQGLAVLFQHYRTDWIPSAEIKSLLYELRIIEVTICLTTLRETSLGSVSLERLQFQNDVFNGSLPFQSLLNPILEFTRILPALEGFQNPEEAIKVNVPQLLQTGFGYLEDLLSAFARIEGWFANAIASKDDERLYHLENSTWGHPSSIIESALSYAYTYADFSTALAVTFYYAIRVKVLDLTSKTYNKSQRIITASPSFTQLSPSQEVLLDRTRAILADGKVYESAIKICQSLEYLFAPENALVGPNFAMFPFHIAFKAFCALKEREEKDVSREEDRYGYEHELAWCWMVSTKYEELHLPSLENLDVGRVD